MPVLSDTESSARRTLTGCGVATVRGSAWAIAHER
jgi:hypothetical protein